MELKNFFAQDDQGNKLPGATCYVYQRGTESLITGLLKANGTLLPNPFAANDDGFIQFAAPNGLYDVRVVQGARDNRLPLQFNDVAETADAARSAAVRAELARDVAQLSVGLKDDIAHGLSTTVSGQYFNVKSGNDSYFNTYKNESGAAVFYGSFPSANSISNLVKKVADIGLGVSDLTPTLNIAYQPVTSVIRNSLYPAAANITAYGAGWAPAGVPVNTFRFWMEKVHSLASLTLEVYSRPTGAAGAMPPDANSPLLATVTKKGPELALDDEWQIIEIRLDADVIVSGTDILVWKLSAAGNLSMGRKNDVASSTQYRRGWYTQGGTVQLIGSPNQLAFEAFHRIVKSTLAENVSILESGVVEQAARLGTLTAMTENASSSVNAAIAADAIFSGSGNFNRWIKGFVPLAAQINRIRLQTDLLTTVHHYQLKLWARPLTSAFIGAPSAADGDLLLLDQQFLAAAYPQVDTTQAISFEFAAVAIPAAVVLIVDVEALTAVGARAKMGLGKITSLAGGSQIERGYYRQGTGNVTAIAAPGAMTLEAFKDELVISKRRIEDAGLNLAALQLEQFLPQFALTGLSLAISGVAYRRHQPIELNASATFAPAATGSETKTVPLKYFTTNTYWTSNTNPWLGRRHISNVVAIKTSDLTPLVQGVNYAYHVNGKLRGLINIAAYDVTVTFGYARERYDLIQVDPQTMAVSVVQGVERDYDAIEYKPSATAGNVPIGYAHIVGAHVEVIPAGEFEGGVFRRGSEGEWQTLRRNNQRALSRFLGKVARGVAVTMAGYGDSITAIQQVDPPYTANGVVRDRPESFLINYPADTLAALPKFDFSDGAGQVHVKVGWNWFLAAEIERRTGQACAYLNFGRGGSTSADTEFNGLYPARLAPVLASGADLLVLAFGMNELGATTTLANIKSIVAQAKAAGMDVVVVSVPRRNAVDGPVLSGWEYTNLALYRAAQESGAAFCPLHWIVDEANLGAMGASVDSLGAAALFNHPGPYELSRYGAVLVESVLN